MPSSGLAVITNGGSDTFVFEDYHSITASFSISKSGVPLFTVSPTDINITIGVLLNNISVQQLRYL